MDWVSSQTGKTINGLYRKPGSNVWRVRETGQEFTEPDEGAAIARFRRISEERDQRTTVPLFAETPTTISVGVINHAHRAWL